MSDLPKAIRSAPRCGSCGRETDEFGTIFVRCEPCGLFYDEDLTASFAADVEPCGEPCQNTWHRPGAIWSDLAFDCVPCPLPETHTSMHKHPCRKKAIVRG